MEFNSAFEVLNIPIRCSEVAKCQIEWERVKVAGIVLCCQTKSLRTHPKVMTNVPKALIRARHPVVYKKILIFNYPKISSSSLTLCPECIQRSESQVGTKKFLFPGTVQLHFLSYNALAANRAVWAAVLSWGHMYSFTFWSNSPSQNLVENVGVMPNTLQYDNSNIFSFLSFNSYTTDIPPFYFHRD